MKPKEWAELVDARTLGELAIETQDPEILSLAERRFREKLRKLERLKLMYGGEPK